MPVPDPKWEPGTGKQVILKEDFRDIHQAILTQPSSRLQPPLVWISVDSVRIEATADCMVSMQFTGMPNILNPVAMVSGGLSDDKIRTITTNETMIMSTGGLYGTTQTEKPLQWYAIFAMAADDDIDYYLKAMPYMRVKEQAGQVISLGTLISPGIGIGYGFTTDELVGGLVYFLTGASKGLMRAITANNNDDAAGGTITYGGAALSMAGNDWFIVLPPNINFRFVGSIFNNVSSEIDAFGDLSTIISRLNPLAYYFQGRGDIITNAAGTVSKLVRLNELGNDLIFDDPGAFIYSGLIYRYPPAHSDTYVKATSGGAGYLPYYATDPALSLIGNAVDNCWLGSAANQRFHIDIGAAQLVTRIYYENYHDSGTPMGRGAKDFTLWGSNDADAFADTTYATDTNWTQIGSAMVFDEHVALDQADPKFISVVNTIIYRYYAFKISTNYAGSNMGFRRIVLQSWE